MLLDKFGRNINYLRLSVTDLCNFRCCYCMPSGGVHKLSHDQVLRLEEILRVARLAVEMGVSKIRITGGEPLLRRNLDDLLAGLASLEPGPDLRITTNGYYLAQKLDLLRKNRISTINISLDTLQSEKFAKITGLENGKGSNALDRVMDGIKMALADGAFAVKLNVVLLGGLNDDELMDFARLTMDNPLAVRFIEYMPVGRHTCYQTSRFVRGGSAGKGHATGHPGRAAPPEFGWPCRPLPPGGGKGRAWGD